MSETLRERLAGLIVGWAKQLLADYDVPPDDVKGDPEFEESCKALADAALATARAEERERAARIAERHDETDIIAAAIRGQGNA